MAFKIVPMEKKDMNTLDVQHSRGGASKVFIFPDKDFLVIFLICIITGRSEMHNGNMSVSWELQSQQIDFLIAYFEAMDKGEVKRSLVINFCDESPKIKRHTASNLSCMQLFDIPK